MHLLMNAISRSRLARMSMDNGIYFKLRDLFGRVDIDRNTAAVIGYGDGIVGMDDDFYGIAMPCQGLINGVIDDLIDQVMQSGAGSGTDIHGRSFADRLQPFEDGN